MDRARLTPAPMDRTDAAWLAGLLDGEGCLDERAGRPRIRLKMSDFDLILRASSLMNGTVYREAVVPGRKPLLVTQVNGDAAAAVMLAVLPFLSARRSARATDLVLTYAERARLRAVPAVMAVAV